MRRAKIICTLGPACASQEGIDSLVAAGMDCARLNFSHGDHETHAEIAGRVRDAAERAGRPVAVLADLSGPKIRIGRFAAGPIELTPGATFTLTPDDVPGDGERVSVSYQPLPDDVEPGDELLLDDGMLKLEVTRIDGREVVCRVVIGGPLSDNKGVNIPGRALSTPAVTAKDRLDLAFAVEKLHVDYLALSFVRAAEDVRQAQQLARHSTPVIAKLEKPEALRNLASIVDAADGVMIARGDLGVELGHEQVPLAQKRIITEGNRAGQLVITATQMLDSMIRNPRPTRAEATDVANAVLDGTDALMLSGETAVGRYPVEAVAMMDRIIRVVEAQWLQDARTAAAAGAGQTALELKDEWAFQDAAAKAAAFMSFVLPLKALVVFTRDGRTARLISEHRPRAPILAVTDREKVACRMALEWGVMPLVDATESSVEARLATAARLVREAGLGATGDRIGVVLGWPAGEATNTVKLHVI